MNTLTMKPSVLFDLTIRHKPWRPNHLRWVIQDLAGMARQPEQDHRTHLRATLEWVCRAQDACRSSADSGCVAAGFSFGTGWLPANADITGRMIETLLPAAEYLAWPVLADRARAMLDALLAQADEGNAGRIHGLIAGHVQLGHGESLARAVCSARALAGMSVATAAQHAQAAHALAGVGVFAEESDLLDAAHRHLEIVLAQQTPCGWFPDSAGPASSAALAGILRSLIETARLLDDPRAWQAALRTGHGLRGQLRDDGGLAGAFDDGWMPAASYVGVTGLTQLAACFLRLAQLTQEAGWRDAAWRALAWIKRNQRTDGDDLALRDALPGTVPIWAGHAAFNLETLAAKYFADVLMMDMVGIAIPPEVQEKNT
jgi:hypothetical protein